MDGNGNKERQKKIGRAERGRIEERKRKGRKKV